MKRFIGIAVIFALAATSVFAQSGPRVSGEIQAGANLIMSDAGDDSEIMVSGRSQNILQARIRFDAGDDRLGARVRISARNNAEWWGQDAFAFVWWRPVDIFRIQLGRNPDGDWGGNQISGWGFTGNAQEFVAVDQDSNDGLIHAGRRIDRFGFAPGFHTAQALTLSLFPIDGLTVNVGVPFTDGDRLAEDVYKQMTANIIWNISNVGRLFVAFQGGTGINTGEEFATLFNNDGRAGWNIREANAFWASFFSNQLIPVDGLSFDFGIGFRLPEEVDGVDIQPPMEIGLGLRYTQGDFDVRFRFGSSLIGQAKAGDTTVAIPTLLGFTLLPNYNLGFMRAFLNVGMEVQVDDDGVVAESNGDSKTYVAWFVNPYIQIPAGGLNFFAGFKLYYGRDRDGGGAFDDNGMQINWKVPIGIIYNF